MFNAVCMLSVYHPLPYFSLSGSLARTESCRCGLVHWRTSGGFDHDRPVRSRRADKANSTTAKISK